MDLNKSAKGEKKNKRLSCNVTKPMDRQAQRETIRSEAEPGYIPQERYQKGVTFQIVELIKILSECSTGCLQVEGDSEDEGGEHDLETGSQWIGKNDNTSNDSLPSNDDTLPVSETVLVRLIHESKEVLYPSLASVRPFAQRDDACGDEGKSQREQDQTGPSYGAFQHRV